MSVTWEKGQTRQIGCKTDKIGKDALNTHFEGSAPVYVLLWPPFWCARAKPFFYEAKIW